MKFFFTAFVCCSLSLFAKEVHPSDAKALGKELMDNLSGVFSIDEQYEEKLEGRKVPAVRNGNWIITTKPISLVDSFSKDTGAITTLFVKVGDEFIRLSTTEEGEKPGSMLSHESPAYKRLLGELRYTGKVTLSGKDYMADYDLFRDRQGREIGAYLVAIPLHASSK
jgi:methyl-accepting chemotaxis protein-2 (aspartate sensor receptor)